jgi:benzoyl-CoA 2,3-dioxygenase component A
MDGTTISNDLIRQHLIDPEICIRCNTCEEICPEDAITHDAVNYVIDFEKCTMKGDCLPPCPTGAIDSYRKVLTPISVEEQFALESLPPDAEPIIEGGGPVPEEVERIQEEASSGAGGREMPPWSAAHPYVSIYSKDHPITATVVGNMRLTEEGASQDIHHIVLDFGNTAFPVLEGQSVGILPPGTDKSGNPHHVRLYSIASPREGERPGYNNIALTVKRVVEDNDGNPVTGVASNYLCDLQKGDKVNVTGPYGTTYLMPNHAGANLIMICTGTGSAPMRAMTERRRRKWARGDRTSQGKMALYFGARTAGELPYFGPLMKLPKEFMDVQLAFSREKDQEKEYVQDRLRTCGDRLAKLLADDNTFIYICGHKRMEDGVNAALADICKDHGMDWSKMREELRNQGRYHVETYY